MHTGLLQHQRHLPQVQPTPRNFEESALPLLRSGRQARKPRTRRCVCDQSAKKPLQSAKQSTQAKPVLERPDTLSAAATSAEASAGAVPECYTYRTASGHKVEALVQADEKGHLVSVKIATAVPSEGVHLNWGVYRTSAAKWFAPDAVKPANSQPARQSGRMRTACNPAGGNGDARRWHLEFRVPKDLAPVSVAFELEVQTKGQEVQVLSGAHGSHFAVPVGMPRGRGVYQGVTVVDEDEAAATCSLNFPMRTPIDESIFLEVDVASFQATPSVEKQAAQERQGKYLGILDRIKHIKALGVTAVLLGPLTAGIPSGSQDGRLPISFFAPEPSLATGPDANAPVQELKQVVQELHSAGIEVLLQIEFCFTGEGTDERPRPSSLRGLDPAIYFRRPGVLNCGHAVTRTFIVDCLRYWFLEFGVDGFCFPRAETLCADRDGTILDCPPLAEDLNSDPLLRQLKMVAQPLDDRLLPRGGVRGFPHWGKWLERNQAFSQDIPAFLVQCQPGMASTLATRMVGSADRFAKAEPGSGIPGNLGRGRRPAHGVNGIASYITGTSLQQLGQSAQALHDAHSGPGGPPPMSLVLQKSLLASELLAQGIPTLTAACVTDPSVAHFVGVLTRLRQRHAAVLQPFWFTTARNLTWHGAQWGSQPDWEGSRASEGWHDANYMAYSLSLPEPSQAGMLYIGLNPYPYLVEANLPAAPAHHSWQRLIDTSLHPPEDAVLGDKQQMPIEGRYGVGAKGVILLHAVPPPTPTQRPGTAAPAA